MLLSWIFYSLLPPILWGATNVIDRFLCSRTIRNEYAMTFVACLLRLPVFLIFLGISGWFFPAWKYLLFVVIAGFLMVYPFLFYFRALSREETPRVMLLYYATSPIITFLLSMIFLGERFSGFDFLGSLLLLTAAVLSIVQFKKGFFRFRTAGLWVLVASIMWPVSDVIVKYLTPFFPTTLSLFAWFNLGGFAAGFFLMLWPEFSRNCKLQNIRWPLTSFLLYILGALLFNVGLFSFLKALSLERVALTIVITAVQPLFVFLFEYIVQRFTAPLERLDLSLASLTAKGAASVFILLGIWLFTL